MLKTGILNVSGADNDRIQTRVGKGGVRKLTRSTSNALGQLSSKEKEKYREAVGKGVEVSWHVKGVEALIYGFTSEFHKLMLLDHPMLWFL